MLISLFNLKQGFSLKSAFKVLFQHPFRLNKWGNICVTGTVSTKGEEGLILISNLMWESAFKAGVCHILLENGFITLTWKSLQTLLFPPLRIVYSGNTDYALYKQPPTLLQPLTLLLSALDTHSHSYRCTDNVSHYLIIALR